MHAEEEQVDRRLEQLGVDAVPEQRRGSVGLDQVPQPVDDQRRVRLVRLEQPRQRLPQRLHHLPVVGQLQIGRREAAREQQAVALGDRQVEVLGQVDEELAARAGPAGLDEAQVLGRDVRVEGQLELAEAASRAPEADQLARGLGLLLGLDDHPIEGSERYTRGNRRAALPPGPLTANEPHDQRRQPMTETLAAKYMALWNEPDRRPAPAR